MDTIVISENAAADAPSVGRARQAAASSGGLVDTMRRAVRHLVSSGADGRLLAVTLVEQQWRQLDAACPLEQDLRPWQLLASDLALALETDEPKLAVRAADLAADMRSTIAMMARNPKGELALRPASRRVLVSLHDEGGRADAVRVREVTGHSVTHLSNILKALRGHGLVDCEASPEDRRRKVLVLTPAGRQEVARHVQTGRSEASFSSGITVRRTHAGEDDYRQALCASGALGR